MHPATTIWWWVGGSDKDDGDESGENSNEVVPPGLKILRDRMKTQEVRDEKMRQAIDEARLSAELAKKRKYDKIRQQGAKLRAKMLKQAPMKNTRGSVSLFAAVKQ